MRLPTLLLILGGLVLASYLLASRRAVAVAGGYRQIRSLHSLPQYYGYYVALWSGIPAILVLVGWIAVSDR